MALGDWSMNFSEYAQKNQITVTGITINKKGESVAESNEIPIITKCRS